jgi:hypothetical protein
MAVCGVVSRVLAEGTDVVALLLAAVVGALVV